MKESREDKPVVANGLASPGAAPEDNRHDAMADRLGRLERACRRWRVAGVALGTGLVLLMGMAAVRRPETVEAEEFVLRDAGGAIRAVWTLRPDQTPELNLLDRAGEPRLALNLSKDGAPGVNLYGPDGSLRAALAVRPDGTPGLGLADERGKFRLSLDLGNDGSSGINLYGEAGALRAALAIRPDGTPALGLFDEHGTIRRSFEIGASGRSTPHGEPLHDTEPIGPRDSIPIQHTGYLSGEPPGS